MSSYLNFIFFNPLAVILAAPFIGSYLGVVLRRLPRDRSTITGCSVCENCQKPLRPQDMVPIFSWLFLQGRCKHCRSPIGADLLAIELLAVGAALWAVCIVPPDEALWITCGLGWTLVTLSMIDVKYLQLPNVITLPLCVTGLLIPIVYDSSKTLDHIIGGAAGYTVFTMISVLYKHIRKNDGLGGGDAKLFAAAGCWLGWQGLSGVLLIGGIASLGFALMRKLRNPSVEPKLPFGPGLSLGLWLSWLYGPISVSI